MGEARTSPAPGPGPSARRRSRPESLSARGTLPAPDQALGTAVLVAAAAAVLGLGGWWWVANAPAQPAPAEVAAPLSPAELQTTEPAGHPPHPSEIVQFDVSQVEEVLPEREEVIRREAGVLTDTGSIDYSGTVPGGAQFVLEYACLGEGEILIEVLTPDGSAHTRRHGCEATLDSLEFAAGSTGHAVVRVVADTARFVGVAVQLSPLDPTQMSRTLDGHRRPS